MADSDKNIRITTNKNKPTVFPNIVFTGSSAGTSVLTLEVRDDNTVAFTGADGDVFSLDYNLSTGTIWSVNDKSGTPLLRASAGGTIGIAELGSGVIVGIGQTNPRYKLDVQGWVGFASTGDGSYTVLVENGLATGNNALSIRASNALRFYNSGNTLYTGFRGVQSGVNTTYILPPTTPAATGTSVLSSSQDGVLSWVPLVAGGTGSGTVNSGTAGSVAVYAANGTAVSGTNLITYAGSGVTIGGTINATSTSAASLAVIGGLGVTGNAFIGGTINVSSISPSVISGVSFVNGAITSGTWAGTVITSLYGGTGFNSYTIGDILVASTGTSLAKLPAGSQNFVLTSNGAGTVPSWQAVPASSASSVAVAPTTVDSSFFITAVSTSSGTGLGLSTVTSFVVNPNTGLLSVSGLAVTNGSNSTSTITGALRVTGGLGLTGNAFIGGTTVITNSTSSTSTVSGALSVTGGLGLVGNAFIGGTVNLTSSAVSVGTNSGALVVTGGVGIGGSLFTGTSVASSISGVIHSNGAITASTVNRLTLTAPATSATLTLANNSSLITSGANSLTFTTTNTTSLSLPTAGTLTTTGNKLSDFAATTAAELRNVISEDTGTGSLVFATSPDFTTSVTTGSATFAVFNTNATNVSAFGAATTLSLGASTGTATFNSTNDTTAVNTGSVVFSGGVGIGRSVSIGGRLFLYNASTFTGFRSNQVGTGSTVYTLPTATPQSAVGTSVLSSTIDGVMSWVGLPVASGSGSPAGSNQQIQFNNSGSFGGATGLTWDNTNNLLSIAATSTLESSSTQVGLRISNNNTTSGGVATRWSPALELVGRSGGNAPGFGVTFNNRFAMEVVPLGVDNPRAYLRAKYSYDLITGSPSYNNDLFRIHSTFGVGIGASNSTSNAISYFRVSTTQSGDVTYILPPGLPSTGTSVLQSDTAGTLTWVGMAAGGTGSGTVNSGTGGSFAVYVSTGTAVNGTNLITFAGSGVTIGGTTNASSTTVAALVVQGGLGITGNAFIGGTTNITNTTASLGTNSGALVVSGGAAVGGTLNAGNMVKVGSLNYAASNVLGAFSSSVDGFNQLIIQNTSTGTNASANLVVNNNQSTDTLFYGEIGMNSSNFSGTGALGTPSAVYVSSTSVPLVLGTTTQHPIRFVVNGSATDILFIDGAGAAISCFANFGLRSASDLRFWNIGNTQYAGIQGGNTSNSYLLTMPTAQVGAGSSVIVTGSDGNQYFAPPGAGIAFSVAGGISPIIRAKRALTLQFAAGYTPLAAGPDNVILKIPQAVDGVSLTTFQLRELDIRVETPSAGQSRIQLEKYTGTTAFTLGGGVGLSMLAGFGITLTGAGTHTTSTSFAAGIFTTSNDKLRLNWTLLNATHANFTIQLTMEEV